MTSFKQQPCKSQLSTGVSSQRKRILDYLKTYSTGLNRFEADNNFNVCHYASRISELKKLGHIFLTVRENATDSNGRVHKRIVRHYWKGFKKPDNKLGKGQGA